MNTSDGSFLTTIQTHRKGLMIADLDDHMRQLVGQVRRTRQASTLTIKIKVSPNSRDNVEVLKLEDDMTISRPKMHNGASIYYADENDGLLRNDPKQMESPHLVPLAEPVKTAPKVIVESAQVKLVGS